MPEEIKDLTMEQMKAELIGVEPKETPAAEAEVEKPASSIEFPAPPKEEAPADAAKEEKSEQPEPGTGETKEVKPEESKESVKEPTDGKFHPKEEKVPEGVQKRINKMTFEKHQAEREKEALARENAELKAKLEANRATDKPAAADADKPANAQSPQPVKPKQDDYETIEEYLDARDKYILAVQEANQKKYDDSLKQRELETQKRESQKQLEAQEQQLAKGWGERLGETAKDHPEVIEIVNGPLGKWIGEQLPEVANTIRRSEVGPQVMLYMQDHAEETLAAAKTGSEIEIAKYVGRVEAQILSQKSTPKTKQPEIPRSPDLPPPPKVAGGQTNPIKGVDLNDEKTAYEDWKREAVRELTAAS